MIEMRWLEGFEFDGDIEHAKRTRVLQFRQTSSFNDGYGRIDTMTDWQNVPVVQVEEAEQ